MSLLCCLIANWSICLYQFILYNSCRVKCNDLRKTKNLSISAQAKYYLYYTYLQNHILNCWSSEFQVQLSLLQLRGGHSKNLRFSSCHWLRQCLKSSRSDLMKVNFQRSPLSSFRRSFRPYWSSPRPISISQLHALPHFHLWPIYLVVFKGSYYLRMRYLILRGASRLDAFSVYPVRAWLPCHGVGTPTGTPAARPSRSSRTKDSSSQISYARAG